LIEDKESIESIHRHFKGIRATQSGRTALLVVYIEANMTWVWADRIAALLNVYQPLHIISLDKSESERPGVTTTQRSKESGVIRLQEALASQSIRFAANMVSDDAPKHRRLLCDEGLGYRYHVKPPKDLKFGKTTATMSGKAPGVKDDCITALHQNMERSSTTRRDPKFVAYCESQGRLP
jgi:hypothetical protein